MLLHVFLNQTEKKHRTHTANLALVKFVPD